MVNKKYKFISKKDEIETDNDNPKVIVSKNHIYLYSDVCELSMLQLNKAINDLNEPGEIYTEIWIHINSYGGSVYDALAAVDTIQDSPTPIITIVEGIAASAASMISVVGDKRYIRSNGTILIHQIRNEFSGKKSDMEDDLENIKKLDNKLSELYVKNTNIKKSEIQKIFKNELEFDAKKCLEMGIVDEIYSGTKTLGKRKR
jgi:ATP-dependent protease ClpP protease subunit